jgi:hypothetical protein
MHFILLYFFLIRYITKPIAMATTAPMRTLSHHSNIHRKRCEQEEEKEKL